MKTRYWTASFILISTIAIWLINSPQFAPTPTSGPSVLAHRGVHQNFNGAGVENDTCTATHIKPPTHNYLENTLPSIQAAISYGADIVEIDVHPTTDGEFAVFHDWTLACRTNGKGRVRDHSSAELQKLDIGYGYTADGGATFPFRGHFIGQMPMLKEVFTAFPNETFLINIKSKSSDEGRLLAKYLAAHNVEDTRIIIYGHQTPINAIKAHNPNLRTLGKQQAKSCVKTYLISGWSGYVPKSCRNSWVPVPENYTKFVWGWPSRFEDRLSKYKSQAVLMGPHTKARSGPAIDRLGQLESISPNFAGIIWTNKIETIGPALGKSDPKTEF